MYKQIQIAKMPRRPNPLGTVMFVSSVSKRCKKARKTFFLLKLPAVYVALPPALAFRFLPDACDEPRRANRNYIK